MTPHVVVDIGNTRIKWGLCAPSSTIKDVGIVRIAALPDDPDIWATQLADWRTQLPPTSTLDWVLTGVQPQRGQHLHDWLIERGHRVTLVNRSDMLPLTVHLEYPERAGIDRLLNAVAAKSVLPVGRGAVLIDAGSAVTIDWLDETHAFAGGSIFPGLDLMAEALHRYTALLPRVQVSEPIPELPAHSTIPAMQGGLFLAVSGGIREAVRLYTERAAVLPRVFFTGGQAPLLTHAMGMSSTPRPWPWQDMRLWPEQTLVGILRTAQALP